MYCPYCGRENENNSRFCGYCGSELNPEPAKAPDFSAPAETVQQPVVQSEQPADLKLAIIGLILANITLTSIAGFIISIIARNKAVAGAAGQPPRGKNKAAKILSTIGIVLGIVSMVILTGIIVAFIVTRGKFLEVFKSTEDFYKQLL